jgi:putative phosphoribosyl transferase
MMVGTAPQCTSKSWESHHGSSIAVLACLVLLEWVMSSKGAMPFEDRRDAGRLLSARLARWGREDVVVLGLTRGGVVVADEIASALGAPLDVVVVRKLRAPGSPELGIGALVAGTRPEVVLDHGALDALAVPPGYVSDEVEHQLAEARLREALLREGRRPLPVAGRTVILVDDGVATGGTMRAAIAAVRRGRPERIVVAIPVAPRDVLPALEELADRVVCLRAPRRFDAVGQFYREFQDVSDGEVAALVAAARARGAARPDAAAVRRWA